MREGEEKLPVEDEFVNNEFFRLMKVIHGKINLEPLANAFVHYF